MAQVIAQLTAPSNWASFLINGDKDYLEPLELQACTCWLQRNSLKRHQASSCEDAGFMRMHSAFNEYPYAADCQEYSFVK